MNQANLGTKVAGIDTGHTPSIPFVGSILKTSIDVFAGTTGAARLGDLVVNADGHTGTIISGSSTVFINGMPAARLGDRVAGTLNGVIIGGEATIQTG